MYLSDVDLIAKLSQLAHSNQYILTKHAREQMINRNMTTDDVHDILLNCNTILRRDTTNDIPSYKIKGGEHDHRLAIKLTTNSDNELIVIITVMDNQVKK